MEVSWKRILLMVLGLSLGGALLAVGTAGEWDLRWVAIGGYLIILAIGAGLRDMGRLLPGRAGAILRDIRVTRLVFWAAVGLMLLLIVAWLVRHGG